MNSPMTKQLVLLSALRWAARVLSILAVGVVLLFAFGEGLNLSHFTVRDLVLFVFFPIGVGLGMALAWRWEGLGGGITIASLAAFYLADRLMSSSFPKGNYLEPHGARLGREGMKGLPRIAFSSSSRRLRPCLRQVEM
jgi:hypothetical protein